MGLLPDNYFSGLNKQQTPTAPSQPVVPTASIQPTINQDPALSGPSPSQAPNLNLTPAASSTSQTTPMTTNGPGFFDNPPVVRLTGDLTTEEQIAKYGGPVGSPEYRAYQAKQMNPGQANEFDASGKPTGVNLNALTGFTPQLPRSLASTLGIHLPDQEEWDKMSETDKIATAATATAFAAGRMVRDLPKAGASAVASVLLTTASPWVDLAKGKSADLAYEANKPVAQLPWLGAVPTYFQSFKQAQDSGMGPLGATIATLGKAAGDVSIFASLGEIAANVFRPRAPVTAGGLPGGPVQDVAPIKYAMEKDGVYRARPDGSLSEYYTIPKTTAKELAGGNTSNTFLKLTPAGSDSVELSVVQTRNGAIPKTVDYVKGKFGLPVKNTEGDFGPEVKIQSQIIKINPTDNGLIPKSPTPPDGESTINPEIMKSIPPKALPGFENKPVTGTQLSTLEQIGDVNGIEPSVRDAVIRTVTGKDVIGEMNQSEYVKAAQTLATFNNMAKYSPPENGPSVFSQYVAPQRQWMRTYEEHSGIPLYSEVYTPMESGIRLRDTFRNSYRNEAREIFGNYAESTPEASNGRRLVSAYMRGETGAITDNDSLNPQQKSTLIDIANKMRAVYDKIGPQVGVPTDIFLKDYQPRIQNIGGIHQLYKEGSDIPKQLDFFAKFKRTGNLQGVQIDDALALFDIYVNSGSNKMFVEPALKRAGALAESLPKTLQGSVKSYVQEKLGYAGNFEKFLDGFVPSINKKLGINLPADSARQLTNIGMSTMYSGMLSSPATWFRQTFQYPLFGYARLGPKFAAEAIKNGLSKAGMDEAHAKGILVDLGVPYGQELAKDTTLGGSVVNNYRKATQQFVKPNSVVENAIRSITFHQAKLQWEDGLSRYNGGKINWPQFEKSIDMSAFSPVDRNIIRQKLVAGDTSGAFDHYARDIVDEVNAPYRRGASSRIGYGLAGKMGSSLMQWPIEMGYTLKRWAVTGQWDKLIRFYAASSAINRTMKETFGFDFSKSLFNQATGGIIPNSMLGPAQNPYSPFVKTALDATNALSAFFNGNKEDFNKNASSVVRTLESSLPGGVLAQNAKTFFRSYKEGPDQDGKYSVKDDSGDLRYKTDFSGLFWGQLMGFPTSQKVSESNLTQDMKNAQYDQTVAKQKILELMQQDKMKEAGDIIAKTGIQITPKDLDDYYIPLNQRTFQTLPAMLKARFAPQVFPNN